METAAQEREETLRLQVLLRPFQKLSPVTFYVDLIGTAVLAWGALWMLAITPLSSPTALWFLLAYIGFFRGHAFIHEVVHFRKKITGLGPLYNLLFGFANRAPYYIHDPHQFHHLPTTFGTAKDPEYMVIAGKGRFYFFLPILSAPILPLILLVRFGVLPIVSWAFPVAWREWLYRHLSTLVVNPGYVRELRHAEDLRTALLQDTGCALYLLSWIALGISGILPVAFFVWMYAVIVATTLVNIYRARVAHRYDNHSGERLGPFAALRDSTCVEGSVLDILWAPIGLKYHSMHHIAPTIPYHNLGKAHAFLKAQLAEDHPYRQTILPNLVGGLRQFWRGVKPTARDTAGLPWPSHR
jgi:fatty acid desaturase